MKRIIAAFALFALSACATDTTPAPVAVTTPASVAAAANTVIVPLCTSAQAAKTVAISTLKGGALSTVQPYANLVDASCNSAQAITTLAADPTSANWIQGITSTLQTAADVAVIVSAQAATQQPAD